MTFWSAFSHSCEYITETIIAQGVGVRSSKDFLKQGHSGAIRRGHNSRKRCIAIFLSKIDDCDIRQVIDGIFVCATLSLIPLHFTVTTKEREQQTGNEGI